MLKTYLYLPEELNQQIVSAAASQNKSKAEIIRQALVIGVAAAQKDKDSSAQTLLKLVKFGKKSNFNGPRDSSEKMDEYLWGKDWNKDE